MQICIVGGFPRAGTRQFTDILNKQSGVSIKGEYYPKVITSLLQTFIVADQVNQNRWTSDNYRKWRMRSALNAYAAFSKGSNAPYNFEALSVAGFKCPRAEVNFEDLRSLIGFERVVFFYCVRNIRDNFLSENSTFGVDVKDYVSKTTASLCAGLDLSQDDAVDFKVLSLDDYVLSANKPKWIIDNILSRLTLVGVSCESVSRYLDKVENVNATERHGKSRRFALTEREEAYMASNNEFNEALKRFKARLGVDLLVG